MKVVNCEVCGKPIPEARLEALPDTLRCVKHSDTKAHVAIFDVDCDAIVNVVIVNEQQCDRR